MRELAERFGVSVGWAFKVSAARRQTGPTARVLQRRAGSRIDLERVRLLVESKPDIILRKLQVELRRAGQTISLAHLARVVKHLGLRLKKSVHATERDTEANQIRRKAFVRQLIEIAPEDLIDLDESGVPTQRTRVYARARRGQRVHAAVPGGHWKVVTILGAMDHRGMLATMTIEAATDRDVFLAYLDEVLCPKLRAGHVVITGADAGQPQRPQGGGRTRTDRGSRGILALPAALLA